MRKTRRFSLIACYGLILLIGTSLSCSYVDAAVVWSEDFSGDLGDWTIHSGNISIQDNTLCFQRSPAEYPDDDWWNIISHESSVIEGTWSFEIFIEDIEAVDLGSPRLIEFQFIAPGTDFLGQSGYSFGIWRSSTSGLEFFFLSKVVDGVRDSEKSKSFTPAGFNGWTDIDISRNSTGHMEVYINSTRRLGIQDSEYETSTSFVIGTVRPSVGHNVLIVDNIEVTDEPISTDTTTTTDPPTSETTPTPTPTPTDTGIPLELLALGIGVPVILVIVLIVWKVRK